jgi:hypothetical protein
MKRLRYEIIYTNTDNQRDFEEFTTKKEAQKIAMYFKKKGYTKIFLDAFDSDNDCLYSIQY